MSAKNECQIRVRWDNAGQCFKALSMDVSNRQQASSTSSTQRAVSVCAGKMLGCHESEVSIVSAVRIGASINAVGKDWECFNLARKGTASQLDLLLGGAP